MPTNALSRDQMRQAIADQLLVGLEDIVWRYRELEIRRGPDHVEDLRAEALTAEVAHQLESARSALRRHPAVISFEGPR